MRGHPLPPAAAGPPPADAPPSRLGAELARRAQRGIPSGGPLVGAAELAGRAGLPGEGAPQPGRAPAPCPTRREEGGRGPRRTTPKRQPTGERSRGGVALLGGGRGGPGGAPARESAARQLAENGRCGEGRRARHGRRRAP